MTSTLTVKDTIRSCDEPCRAIAVGESFQANLTNFGELTKATGTVTAIEAVNGYLNAYTVDWGETIFPTGYTSLEGCFIESFGCPTLACCPESLELSNVDITGADLTLTMDNGDVFTVRVPQCSS